MTCLLSSVWFLAMVLKAGSSSCSSGWTSNGTTCYGLMQNKINWTSAEADCVSKGGHLVSIGSPAENSFVHNFRGGQCNTIWIGLKRKDRKSPFEWTDGTVIWDLRWANDPTHNGNCVKMGSAGKWKAMDCQPTPTPKCYVCETATTQAQTTAVAPSSGPCDEHGIHTLSSTKFSLGLKATSWSDATGMCLHRNESLASLLSQQEEDEVLAKINHLDSNHCCKKTGGGWWIGLKREKHAFVWSDNSKFEDWKSLTVTGTNNSSYECVLLFENNGKLQWRLGLCSQEHCFVCKSKTSGATVTTSMHSSTTALPTTTLTVPITRTTEALAHEVITSPSNLPTAYPSNSRSTATTVSSTTGVPTLASDSEPKHNSDHQLSITMGFVIGGTCVAIAVVFVVLGVSCKRKRKKAIHRSEESHAGNSGGVYRFRNAIDREKQPDPLRTDIEQATEMGVVDDYSSQACVYAYVTTAVNGSTQKDGYESVTVDRNNIICLPGDRQEKNGEVQVSNEMSDDIYWQPAKSVEKLYAQFEGKRFRRILRSEIRIHETIGSGEFGTVAKGMWQGSGGGTTVAVKMLNSTSDGDRVRFLQEGAIMGQFRHDNIVALCGLVLKGEPLMLALEFMENGDLKKYLQTLRQKRGLGSRLLRMAREIAAGMKYLAQKAFIHRDLAVRNVMLDKKFTCKIGDFGLSRDLVDNNYYVTHGGRIPIRWTAPEAIMYRKYSLASDVWSYGIILYEIWTVGRRPYDDSWSNNYLMEMLDEGYRLPPPPGSSYAIYKMMIQCWHPDRHYRPPFDEITHDLGVSDDDLLVNGTDVEIIHGRLGDDVEVTSGLYSDLQNAYSGIQIVE